MTLLEPYCLFTGLWSRADALLDSCSGEAKDPEVARTRKRAGRVAHLKWWSVRKLLKCTKAQREVNMD